MEASRLARARQCLSPQMGVFVVGAIVGAFLSAGVTILTIGDELRTAQDLQEVIVKARMEEQKAIDQFSEAVYAHNDIIRAVRTLILDDQKKYDKLYGLLLDSASPELQRWKELQDRMKSAEETLQRIDESQFVD